MCGYYTNRKEDKIMKKIAAVLAIICAVTAAGCSNGDAGTASQTEAAETKEKVTLSLSDDDNTTADSTDEALEYLDGVAPLFANYLRERRTTPLTFETEITTEGAKWITKLYIEDADTCAMYSEDPDGGKIKVIYDGSMGYQIDYNKKSVYAQNDLSAAEVKAIIEAQSLSTLSYSDVSNSTYVVDTEEYEGTEYDHVRITEGSGVSADNYFDKSTGKLAYSVSGGYATKVITFENAITDSTVFDIPQDFEQKTFEDLVAEYNEANAEAAE